MTKEEFISWAKGRGWGQDKYGHLQKTIDKINITYRFKLQANSVRYERQARIVDHNEWLRIMSGYYKDLSINGEGKLVGLKR